MKQVFNGFYEFCEMLEYVSRLSEQRRIVSYRWNKDKGTIEVEFANE